MRVGFFSVFRRDPQHYLHATGLIRSVQSHMPDLAIVHFTDERSPQIEAVTATRRLSHGPMLERRLEHYASCDGDWLLVDTDVEIRADVRDVFDDPVPWDLAIADRRWPGIPQGDDVMLTMPYNSGVVFSRISAFWGAVLSTWRGYDDQHRDWLSEQRAVWEVIRTGRYRVKVLDGTVYNRPPAALDDPCSGAKIVHFKGPRKAWYSAKITKAFATLQPVGV